ncbi:MAG: histidine kinase [Lachnospiraceae bacterium]|nr:histidine kinase [Lachnospiraceae bacterium]
MTTFTMEALGHLLQLGPAMILYFLCIPEELFRRDRKKTIIVFGIALLLVTVLRVFLKLTIPGMLGAWGSHEVGSILLLLEIALLIVAAPLVVDVPPFRNMMVLFIVFFGGCAQIMIVNLFQQDRGVFTPPLVLAYALVTVVLFPVMKVLFAGYVQEYIRISEARHIKSVFAIVCTLTLAALAQVMMVSWIRSLVMVPVTVVLIITMMMIYWMFLRYVVIEEREDRLRRHLLASQIRPHFIYNTMNTIHGLCDENVEEAKQAICDFSDYLRANFESYEKSEPVPFQKELEHTHFYLSLEKLRFREELQVVYDIQAEDFRLPPLTVQPLVENAVRHGIRKKTGAGTLTLRTRETNDAFEIVIEDDGAGFDTDSLMGDAARDGAIASADKETFVSEDHIHIGIANARARVERISKGTLQVESMPGRGTTVTIRIPKKGREIP